MRWTPDGDYSPNAIRFSTSTLEGGELSLCVPTAWPSREEAHCQLNRRLYWVQYQNGHDDEKQNFCHCRKLKPRRSRRPMWGWDIGPNIIMCREVTDYGWNHLAPWQALVKGGMKLLIQSKTGKVALHKGKLWYDTIYDMIYDMMWYMIRYDKWYDIFNP